MAENARTSAIIAVCTVVTTVIGVVSFLAGQSSERGRDFSGLVISADLDLQGGPTVDIPKSSNGEPIELFLVGSVSDTGVVDAPIAFRVAAGVVDVSRASSTHGDDGFTLHLENVRPLICQEVRPNDDCSGLEIDFLSIEARFDRGPKTATVSDNLPMPLS